MKPTGAPKVLRSVDRSGSLGQRKPSPALASKLPIRGP